MMAKRELDCRELGMVAGGSWWGDIAEAVGKMIETQAEIATTAVVEAAMAQLQEQYGTERFSQVFKTMTADNGFIIRIYVLKTPDM